MARPIFSGHESFACKSHWLKRGYDFVIADRNFNDDDAVVHLGVGKNMVASIRFWLKAVGLLQDNELNPIADYLFNDENGQDPYIEVELLANCEVYRQIAKSQMSEKELGLAGDTEREEQ